MWEVLSSSLGGGGGSGRSSFQGRAKDEGVIGPASRASGLVPKSSPGRASGVPGSGLAKSRGVARDSEGSDLRTVGLVVDEGGSIRGISMGGAKSNPGRR